MSMEKWQVRSRTVHKLNVAERAAFCKQNNMTELDLLRIEYGEDWWKQPLPLAPVTWQFALGKDLLLPKQTRMLPTRMRQLHTWYKMQNGKLFGARYLDEDLHKVGDIVWVEFEHLYHFYQQAALDVSIMTLWTM